MVLTIEGYSQGLSSSTYSYYRRDHLGNNREVWCANTNGTVQRTQYYPSGLPWAEGEGQEVQNKKYNGKEWIEAHGLDVTDLGNRGLYHATNRFTTMDRFAEKYPWQSPYVFAGNNPVNYVDVNGDSIRVTYYDSSNNQLYSYFWGIDTNGVRGFIGYVAGTDGFIDELSKALTTISSKENGAELVDKIVSDTKKFDIYDTRNLSNSNTRKDTNFANSSQIGWNSIFNSNYV